MEINQRENELHLYPINNNEYLGAIYLNGSNMRNVSSTTIILDQSASMGSQVSRFVRQIIPLVMSKLGYAEDYGINLISFARYTTTHYLTSRELQSSNLVKASGTKIAPAIAALRSILQNFERNEPGVPMRVLTISDGEISDPIEAENEAEMLVEYLARSDLTINSQAVRLFTSDNQPDTKALSYLLQINNCTTTQLYDASKKYGDETIANEIVKLFQKDCFQSYQLLNFERSIVLKFPWNSHASMRVILQRGWNIFWFKQVPSGVKLGYDYVNVIVQNDLSLVMFYELMESKLEYIADHMIILKVVGTSEAKETVNKIFACLQRQEQALACRSASSNNRVISNLLDGIAKNRTNFHDSKQMAEFLRNTKREIEKQQEMDRKKRENEKAEAARKKAEEDAAAEAALIQKLQEDEAKRIQKLQEEKDEAERIQKLQQEKDEAERIQKLQQEKDEAERIQKLQEEKDEAERIQKLQEEKDEAERIQKLQEEKDEAERIQKLQDEKDEAERIQKLQEEKDEAERIQKLQEEKDEAERIQKLQEEKDEAERIQKLQEEKDEAERIQKLQEEKDEAERIQKLQDEKDEAERIQKLQEEKDEAERIQKLQEEKDEAERIQKLQEEKDEAERIQKLQDEKDETERIQKLQDEKDEAERIQKLQEEKDEAERIQKLQDEKDEAERIQKLQEEKDEAERIQKLQEEKDEAERIQKLQEEKDEAERIQKLQDEKDETERIQKLQDEKDEAERIQKLQEEKDEAERIQKLQEEKDDAERIQKLQEEKDDAERIQKLQDEKDEAERIKKLQDEDEARIKRELDEKEAEEERAKAEQIEKEKEEEEAELIKREQDEKDAEEERTKRDEEQKAAEADRIERENADRIKQEAEEHKKHEAECERRAEGERIGKELDITGLKSNLDSELDPFQTVFILDERLSDARANQRFAEKIVPLMLTKLFSESLQLVHLVTFVRYKTTFEELQQSLLQALDASKQIRIIVLTNEKIQRLQETENFAEILIRFLSTSNYSFELQVVRLASNNSITKKFKVVDIDASESNDFIAKQVAGFVDKKLDDFHIQDSVEKPDSGNYCCVYYIVFIMIFILLTVRYIYLVSRDD